MSSTVIRVPTETAEEFRKFWREIRSAEGFLSEMDLKEPDELARFDGASMAEWVVPLTHAAPTIITGILGFLVARRGEIEIDGKKFRNLTAKQIREVLAVFDEHDRRKKE